MYLLSLSLKVEKSEILSQINAVENCQQLICNFFLETEGLRVVVKTINKRYRKSLLYGGFMMIGLV